MAKYILRYSDLQRADIIIDREDSDESLKIRRFTHSDYSHARLYVNASVMEANGLGVQSVNPQRILYDSPDDVVVLRCKEITEEQKIRACLFARSEFAKEYSLSGSDNTQYCFRLVAEAYQYAGVEITKTPTRCNANDFLNSEKLVVVRDMVREASDKDLAIAQGEGVLKDKGHYNKQTEVAVDMFSRIRDFVQENGGDAASIQDDGRLFSFLVENPKYDTGIAEILRGHEYFQLWKEHERTHPWELNVAQLLSKFEDGSGTIAKQILDSCDGDNVIAWHMMHQITGRIYDEYHIESAKIYRDFYQEILHWNDRRRETAENVLAFLSRIYGFDPED
jgi:hypothetical protein